MENTESLKLLGSSMISFTEMIASTPSCLKVITKDGTLLSMNPQGLSLIEAEGMQNVLGADVYDLIPEEHRARFIEFNNRICSGEKGDLVFEMLGMKGARRWMETYAAPYKLTNGETAHIAITNDITKKVEAEQQILHQNLALASSARLASLGQFVGGIAHEINNPLSVILGKLTLLEMKLEKDSIEKAEILSELGKVINTTERISDIINNLKTFSRDPQRDALEKVPLASIVKDTLSLCFENFRLNNISLSYGIDTGITVECQKVQVSQVLMNLVNNSFDAVKADEERWVKIDAGIKGDTITMMVTDSGKRISKKISELMLTPFFTTKEVGEGTGLGLSISSQIMSSLGGRLYYNKENQHTQFVLEFPCRHKLR
ncbi:MAG: PAS domain S-box-containing protein [Pseudohongiellaceae bacterium]